MFRRVLFLFKENLKKGFNRLNKKGTGTPVPANDQFQDPVDAYQFQRLLDPVDDPAGQVAAQAQAAHEDGQDDADGKGRTAYDLGDHAGPQDFVCQARDPGKEEADEDQEEELSGGDL